MYTTCITFINADCENRYEHYKVHEFVRYITKTIDVCTASYEIVSSSYHRMSSVHPSGPPKLLRS